MARDISPEHRQVAAARTAKGSGFVVFVPVDVQRLASADLVLLRDPDGRVVAARYIGMVTDGTDAATQHDQVDLLRVSSGGVPLGDLIDDLSTDASSGSETHAWGALGLPDGPATPVCRLDDTSLIRDDVAVAHASAGHHRYRTDRSLSITPGDVVRVGGTEARITAIDRRARTAEIDVGDEVREVAFVEIDDLEGRT